MPAGPPAPRRATTSRAVDPHPEPPLPLAGEGAPLLRLALREKRREGARRWKPVHDRSAIRGRPDPILDVLNIEVIYNSVALVLKGVSLSVPKGGIVALLGANGAGKTTTLKAISNLLRAERGEVTKGAILFEGERVDRLSPNELVRRGAIQVMEGRHCFGHLTIEENLLTGAFTRRTAEPP